MRFLYLLFYCSAIFAQSPIISSSEISYHGSHFMHDWVGISKSADSKMIYDNQLNSGSVSIRVRLDSFDSRLSSRDSNMLFYADAMDHPVVLFKSTNINIKSDSVYIEGDMTFHGITKQIKTVAAMFTRESPKISGSFNINLSDYNIERPTLLFVKIADKIRIEYSFIIE